MKVDENYSPLNLNENNRFSIPFIFYIPLLVGYAIYGSRPHDIPLVGQYFPTPTPSPMASMDPTFTPAFSLDTLSPVPTFTPAYLLASSPTPSPTASLFPFDFPVITNYGSYYMTGQIVQFSYYYPPLGGVNCHSDNWVNGQCKNYTASGEGWIENMGKGIAVHPDMLNTLPFGSEIYVSYPEQIKGFYKVIDLCGGCLINGKYYFDFLFSSMPPSLNWSVDVGFVVTRIGYYGVFPPTRTPSPLIFPSSTPTAFPTAFPTYTPYPTYTPFPDPSPIVVSSPVVTDTPIPFP